MESRVTEVLIIGSGFGAAAPALRLAQAGLGVTMLEQGPRVGREDFRQTQDPGYIRRYLHGLTGSNLNLTYAEALGGGSGFYEGVSLRAPSRAFEQVDGDGQRLWPRGIDRAALDPYYEVAEHMLRVEQIAEDEIPKSGLVFSKLMKDLGYSCDRSRFAIRNCLGSGHCVTGCIYGAKQSLHLNYLPQALEAGATIECGIRATRIQPLVDPGAFSLASAHQPLGYAVTCQRDGGGTVEYRARMVVLAGGTVGSARLLLASRPWLPRLSHAVGQHVAFNGGVKIAGLLPPGFPDGDMLTGRSVPGMISYEFLESHGITIFAAKPLPVQLLAAARIQRDGAGKQGWWGNAHVELMRQYRHRMIVLVSLGLTPPAARLTLDREGTLQLELPATAALEAHQQSVQSLLESILTRNGGEVLDVEFTDSGGQPLPRGIHYATAHQVGSCRMADAPKHGVCDATGEVFGYPGLYVSDGAAIPSSLAVNTSLTILANAERIARGIVGRLDAAPALVATH